MKNKGKQVVAWVASGLIIAAAVTFADECTFQWAGGWGPCAVVQTCIGNVPHAEPGQPYLCDPAKTWPPEIYKSCIGSGTNRYNCLGRLYPECYRDTTCEAYEAQEGVPPHPVWKCKAKTASGNWTPAEEKYSKGCLPAE